MRGLHGPNAMNFKDAFPNLRDVAKKKTSDADPNYNCIAWAFKDNRRHWWPNNRRSYWPINTSGLRAIEAFEAWFSADGWVETSSQAVEHGYEKIALYVSMASQRTQLVYSIAAFGQASSDATLIFRTVSQI
jgi:hypothetical protein